MRIYFHPAASQELHEAALWYEDQSLQAGSWFVDEVHGAVEAIRTDPGRYQRAVDEVRVFRLKRFPYRLYFAFDADRQDITIYALMHEKRHPGCWHDRLVSE
jgi:toxin ParE1/3/4